MQQYIIVYGFVEELCQEVNKMLAEGWLPLGPPFVAGRKPPEDPLSPVRLQLAQALVCGDAARRLEGAKP